MRNDRSVEELVGDARKMRHLLKRVVRGRQKGSFATPPWGSSSAL